MARCDSYLFGECTWGACEFAPWVPEDLGDGGDWAANAAGQGFQVTMTPTAGAAVSYCRGDGYSSFGHCAIVTAVYADGTFQVHEMNYAAYDEYDDRHSTVYDVCGFILPPGVQPGQGGSSAGRGSSGTPNDVRTVWAQLQDTLNNQVPLMASHMQWLASRVIGI